MKMNSAYKIVLSSGILIFLFFQCSERKRNAPIEGSGLTHSVVAYVTKWEDNWGDGYQRAKSVTRINYAFANVVDGLVVEGGEKDEEDLRKLNGLKKVNPNLKILISVGGWTWSGGFSDAVYTESSREKFANSAVAYLIRHNIDGIDLDWEYPGLPGNGNTYRPEDKDNFTVALRLIRTKLDSLAEMTAENYLLTIAAGANQGYLDHVDMDLISNELDFINIMTYDFHGGWEEKTGHHANLKPAEMDDNAYKYSIQATVEEFINNGAPVEKLLLGVPFYGKWWGGVQPVNEGLYQPTDGLSGTYTYSVINDSLLNIPEYQAKWDSTAKVPYIWNEKDSIFISYENRRSLEIKLQFLKDQGMKGVMFWQFNGDNNDLLQTIADRLKKEAN